MGRARPARCPAGPPQPPARRCGSPRRAAGPLVVDGAQSIQRRSRSHQTAAGMARWPSVTAARSRKHRRGPHDGRARQSSARRRTAGSPDPGARGTARREHAPQPPVANAGRLPSGSHPPCPPCDRVKVLSMVSGRARSARGTPATREWNQSAGLGVVSPPRTAAASAPALDVEHVLEHRSLTGQQRTPQASR